MNKKGGWVREREELRRYRVYTLHGKSFSSERVNTTETDVRLVAMQVGLTQERVLTTSIVLWAVGLTLIGERTRDERQKGLSAEKG